VRVVEGEDSPGAVIRLPGVVEEEVEENALAARSQTPRGGSLELSMRGSRVVVENVAEGSTAARAGLQEGDVLVSVDGEPVRSAAQARGMLSNLGRRGPRTLQVRRDQNLVELRFGAR
jgi:S1-C subfamily serine protease